MNKRTIIILVLILVTAVALPLAVYLVQQQQELRSRAAPATTLAFNPQKADGTVNSPLPIFILMSTDQNQVSAAELHISISDPSLLQTITIEQSGNTLPLTLVQGSVSGGTASITVGANPGSPAQGVNLVIAKLTLNAKNNGQITLKFTSATRIAGVAEGSNVLASQPVDAVITITGGPGPTATPGPTAAPGAGGVPGNNAPTCSSLSLSPGSSGTAPFAATFTVNGNDKDAGDKITKVTFNFGDGKIEDMFDTGGIGTNQVSAQKTHSFVAPGSYKVLAFLTDSNGGTSSQDSCTQTITVTAAGATPGAGGPAAPTTTPSVTGVPTPTGVAAASPTPQPVTKGGQPIPEAGNVTPTTIFLGVGAFLLLLGGVLLFL